jgi:hypothetical protein
MGKLDYAERQEDRKERLEGAADRARSDAERAFASSDRIADAIPLGQPILVGHHSEGHHRRDIARMRNSSSRAMERLRDAAEYERRAAAIGKGGISSDDPEAIAKLTTQVETLDGLQERMKAANKLVKKGDRAGLLEMGFVPARVEQLFQKDFMGNLGFAPYAITNNGANIRRIRERIVQLEAAAKRTPMETIIGAGWTLSEDVDDNRILIEFNTKPAAEIREALKRGGFKWSPTRGAHIRMTSNGAIYQAKSILGIPL